ncbi:MAG: VCBS repeat-containing protein [Candidatus Desantisbacteria bacterium]
MKRLLFLMFLLFIVFSCTQANASSPTFYSPEKLKSTVLDCGASIALSLGDLDGDSKRDMVVGEENGFIWFYENSGQENSPRFTTGIKLCKNTGLPIQVGRYSTPQLVNWDTDNLLDLLIGDESGQVWLYKNIGTATSPLFDNGVALEDNNGEIDAGNYSTPYFADYNGDGKLDLIVGNDDGFVWYYPKQYNEQSYIFGTGTRLRAMKAGTMTEMNVGSKAAPIFYDWTEDGLRDMIVGDGYGYLNYFRNTGTKTNPVFGTVSLRIKANNLNMDVGEEAKPVIIDWDMDGKKDVLIGNTIGQITLFRNTDLLNSNPQFSSGSKIQGQGEEAVDCLDVGGFSSPVVVDWNGDTRKDLVVGDELGNISVYLNLGTNKSPIFGAGFNIQTNGTATTGDLDIGCNSMPVIVDWNEDRRKDMVIGDGYGKIWVYLNIGTDKDPVFGSGTILQKTILKYSTDTKTGKTVGTSTYEDIDVGENASIAVVDWNNDRAMDLVVGNFIGDIGILLNTGSNKQPVFGTITPLLSDGININVRRYAVPFVCDWNNDGRKDLLVGSGDGVVYLYLNQGTDAAPVFPLACSLFAVDENIIDVGENSTPALMDWNDDGYKDLLTGNAAGEVFLCLGGITNSPPNIEITTPAGTQSQNVSIFYTLRDLDSDSINTRHEYSTDGGFSGNWKQATPSGMGGDGQASLFSTPDGIEHVFVWNALADLGKTALSYQVIFRITPSDTGTGTPAVTTEFIVDNITVPKKSLITVGGAVLDVRENAKPFVVDWNNDGRKDLLVGNKLGEVYYLQNVGTDKNPLFEIANKISSGADILDVGYSAAPVAVFGWDNYGKKDLIVGDEYGNITYYRNTGSDNSPSFDQGTLVGNGTRSTVDVGYHATPFIYDWNNDGKKDLVVGKFDGGIDVFINIGTDNNPAFGSATPVIIGTGTNLDMGNNSTVFIIDWNGDGKKDIISGSKDGRVYQILNYGTDNASLFYRPTPITIDSEVIDVGEYSAPVVCDWNNDGVKDLLIGNEDGQIVLYLLSSSKINTLPRVEMETPKGRSFGSVTIAYSLSDDQWDICSLEAKYSTDGLGWKNASVMGEQGLTSSPEGESHGIIWLSEKDLPATLAQVWFRITPNDGNGYGTSSQVSFTLNNINTYPEVTLITIIGTASGCVGITFKVRDADNDSVNIGVEYSAGNLSMKSASVVGTTSGLSSGATAMITWLSTVDEPLKSGNYRIRITPSDYQGQGTPTISEEFSLNQTNYSSKIIAKGTTPTLTFSPTRLAIQKPFDEDVLTTTEILNTGLPQMETYPELNNTARKITVIGLIDSKPIVSFQATLTISYGTMTNYATEQFLQMYELQEGRWIRVGSSSVDVNANEVSQLITHSGVYRIGLSIPATLKASAWVAPNPFKPNGGNPKTGTDRVVFGNLKGGTMVKIYTISGELVKESGIINYGVWNWYAKNEDEEAVGSGIYIFVISCGDEAAVIGKLAVIR